MSEVKVFRVTGELRKPNLKTPFRKEVRALKPENAEEKIFMEFGSKHRAKRFQIKIFKIKEVSPEEIEDPMMKRLAQREEADAE